MATIPTSLYSSVKKVVEFNNLYYDIVGDAIGTGDTVTTVFNFSNRKVVQNTDFVYLAGVATTAYTIDYDKGQITFTSAPAAVAITADYWYCDIPSSVIGQFIVRAEDEINRRTNRYYGPPTQFSEYFDGNADNSTNYYIYQSSTALSDMQAYKTLDREFWENKTIFTSKFPITAIALVATDVVIDAAYAESNRDSAIAFGSTKWVSQSFVTASADPIVQIQIQMAYNTGTVAALTVGIYANSGGSPTGSALATATISAFTSTTYQFYDAVFTNPLIPTSGTTYHIVISSPSASTTSVFNLAVDGSSPTYTNGQINTSANSGVAWTADATKDAIFNEFVGKVQTSADYTVVKDTGRITFTTASGDKMTKGNQNLLIVYQYGYGSVPVTVEMLATELAGVYAIQSRLLGDPSQNLDIKKQNLAIIQEDIKRMFASLGEKLEVTLL